MSKSIDILTENQIFILPIKKKKKYECEHGKIKYDCRECGGSNFCVHDRQKKTCKDCGGSQVCEHNRIKSVCRDCGGISICEHGKIKLSCKTCKGVSICEHNKFRYCCKDCKGNGICEHNKRRYHCKDCKGEGICEHEKYKSRCIECGGSQICEHQKLKSKCVECGGSEMCEHKKQKSKCIECGGSEVCIHKIRKSRCLECGGNGLCEHKKNKYNCRICKGSGICIHGIRKYFCNDCDGRSLCIFCKITKGNSKYEKHCLRCFIHLFPDKPVVRNYKTKEKDVTNFVTNQFPDFQWIEDKRVMDGCSKRRPDLLLDLGYQVLVVEVDENQHKNYGSSCDNMRLMELSQDVDHRPIIFLRFNPDGYINSTQMNIKSCWGIHKHTGICMIKPTMKKEWEDRLNLLKEQIEYWSKEENKTEKTVEIVHLYYDGFD